MKDLGIDVESEFMFDRNGVIRNFDEIEEKYKKAAEEGDKDAYEKWNAIQKFIEKNKDIKSFELKNINKYLKIKNRYLNINY